MNSFIKWIPAALGFMSAFMTAITPEAQAVLSKYVFVTPALVGLIAMLGVLAKSPIVPPVVGTEPIKKAVEGIRAIMP